MRNTLQLPTGTWVLDRSATTITIAGPTERPNRHHPRPSTTIHELEQL